MSSVGPVAYDAFGPIDRAYGSPVREAARTQEPAPPEAPGATAAPQPAVSAATPSANPGTVADVMAANVSAKGSAELFGSPTDDYASSMSQLVSAAVAQVQRLGGRLDTQM